MLWEVSRSSRDFEEYVGLINAADDNAVKIVVDGRRYDPGAPGDRQILLFMGMQAEAEGRNIRKRNIDSVLSNAANGTPHGRLPYGFRRVYDPGPSRALLYQTPYAADLHPDEIAELQEQGLPLPELLPEAQAVRDAAYQVLAGTTLRSICRKLDDGPLPSPRKPSKRTLSYNPDGVVYTWQPQSLRQILLSPTIAGRRKHRGEDIGSAAWPAIVPYDDWLRMRAILTDPSRRTVAVARGPVAKHLLSGIALCGECGARMKAVTNMSRMPRAYTCRHEGCMRVTVTAGRVDDAVEDVLEALFVSPGFRSAIAAAYDHREQARVSGPDVGALIAAKEAELDEVEAMRGAGEITLRAYAAESKRIEDAIAALQDQQVAAVTSPALRRLLAAETLVAGWKVAGLPDKREIVRLLLDVVVKRSTVRGRRFDVDRLVVDPSAFLRNDVLTRTPDQPPG